MNLICHPDFRLRYRRGYFDRPASDGHALQLRDVLLSPINAVGIPLSAELARAGRGYELNLSIGLAELALRPEGDRWRGKIEIIVLQTGADGEQVQRLDQTLGLNLKKETYETLNSGFRWNHSLTPKPRTTSLRLLVRAPASGALGSLTIPLELH